MATLKTPALISKIKKAKKITEQEVKLISKRLKSGEDIDLDFLADNDTQVDKAQFDKGLKWLTSQYKTPKGKLKDKHPFGVREVLAIENAKTMELIAFHNTNWINPFYVPVYSVTSPEASFDYYFSGGKFKIYG